MYGIYEEEHFNYNTVSSHVTQITCVLYKFSNDWQQRTAQPDIGLADFILISA